MDKSYGIEKDLIGKWAECDGGSAYAAPGTPAGMMGAREFFRGRLTGQYYEEGEPPWRWYYLTDLSSSPPDWETEGVWCEHNFIFIDGDEDPPPGPKKQAR